MINSLHFSFNGTFLGTSPMFNPSIALFFGWLIVCLIINGVHISFVDIFQNIFQFLDGTFVLFFFLFCPCVLFWLVDCLFDN